MDEEAGWWVDAAPFRALVDHLMTSGALTIPEVAELTGISPQLIRRLLTGRSGRPVRRISPATAVRLISTPVPRRRLPRAA